jgi:FkbM family methyltransferase
LLDVGAHFGLFSLAALHFGGPAARAVAIDPSPIAARILHAQIRLNSLDRIRVMTAAAGDSAGRKRMLAAGVLGSFYYTPPGKGRPTQELTDIEQVTLDGVAAECGFEVTHLKVDVEGAEAEALRGARQLLGSKRPPIVFLELHTRMVVEQGGAPDNAIKELTAAGYSMHSLDGSHLDIPAALALPLTRVIAARPNHESVMAGVRSCVALHGYK